MFYFILSYFTSVVRAMKKRIDCSFNIMTTAASWVNAILKVMPKLVIMWVTQA